MRTLVFTLLPLAIATCPAQTLIHHGSADALAWSQIEAGSSSPIAKPGIEVIKSQHDFDAFNALMKESNLKRPAIDWAHNEIVVVTSQGYANEGFGLTVTKLHITSPGNVYIEESVSKDIVPQEHLAASYNFPYAILETTRVDVKWHVRVVSP